MDSPLASAYENILMDAPLSVRWQRCVPRCLITSSPQASSMATSLPSALSLAPELIACRVKLKTGSRDSGLGTPIMSLYRQSSEITWHPWRFLAVPVAPAEFENHELADDFPSATLRDAQYDLYLPLIEPEFSLEKDAKIS